MKATTLISALVATTIVSSLHAADFDLRMNMLKLNSELADVQRGIMHADKNAVAAALNLFEKDVNDLLSDEGYSFKKKIYDMFPEGMTNKKHKVTVAMKQAREMETNIKVIKEMIENKEGLTTLKRKRVAQEAYSNIVGACFECHNLVRDK
jgi:hypothetical protein